MIEIVKEEVGPWDLDILRFANPTRTLKQAVLGLIGNSITTSESGKDRTATWKLLVGNSVRRERGETAWSPSDQYAITLGFSFHPGSHGSRPLDVENFIKPTLDAFAAGLFSGPDKDLAALQRWDFDDSNFNRLFTERLADAHSPSGEGVAVFVTSVPTHSTDWSEGST